jgi:DNA-binding MarR family transcriptional regulator
VRLFASRLLRTRLRISASRPVREEALLSARLNDLHMIVLGTIAHFAGADVEDIADWLGVPVAVAEALCADLEDAGLVTSARGHCRLCSLYQYAGKEAKFHLGRHAAASRIVPMSEKVSPIVRRCRLTTLEGALLPVSRWS